jgi:hypothetical protein
MKDTTRWAALKTYTLPGLRLPHDLPAWSRANREALERDAADKVPAQPPRRTAPPIPVWTTTTKLHPMDIEDMRERYRTALRREFVQGGRR